VPPITLTKPQFLKKRPQARYGARGTADQRYQSYLNFIKSARDKPPVQAPRIVPKAPPGPKLPTYLSLLKGIQIETPAQIEARANRLANQGITAQQKLIRDEAAAMRKEAMSRMEAMAAAGRAAAQMIAGLFGMVGGEYNAAAGEIRGLATGGAGEIAGMTAADVANVNQGLAAVGAPGVTQGPPGSAGMAGPGQAGVEAYIGGELPGQALGTAGQAATFGLAGMVSAQNLRATQEAQASLRQSIHEINANRMAAMKELAAGRPQAAAQYIAQFQTANARARDTAMSLLAAQEAFKTSRQQRGLRTTADQRAAAAEVRAAAAAEREAKADAEALRVSKLNRRQAVQEAALKGREVDLVRSRALKYYVDMQGRPILKNGKRIKFVEKPSTDSLAPSKTIGEVRQEVSDAAEDYVADSYGGRNNDKLIRTKRQLVDHLRARFPGVQKEVIWRIANAAWPKVSGKSGGGGSGPGKQPGT
jgi:hypothetical protein